MTEDNKAKRAELVDQYSEEAVQAYEDLGIGDDDFSDFEESYSGEFSSDEDFARDMAEQLGDIPRAGDQPWPLYCIDWEWAARELMMDYSESNGHYFRNI